MALLAERVDPRGPLPSAERVGLVGANLSSLGALPVTAPLLWFDVSRLSGYGDGAAVGALLDQSVNARHAVQATAAARPLYRTNVLNGFPVLRFNGSSSILSTPSIALAGAGMAIFTVAAQRVSQASTVRLVGWNGANVARLLLSANHGQLSSGYGGTNGLATIMAQGAFGVCTMYYDTARLYAYMNGANASNNPASGGVTTAACDVGGGNGTFLDGDMAEVLVYDRLLTTAERQATERYLGAKYGIVVA